MEIVILTYYYNPSKKLGIIPLYNPTTQGSFIAQMSHFVIGCQTNSLVVVLSSEM